MVERLRAFWNWLHADCFPIVDMNGKRIPLRPNLAQQKLFEAMMVQAIAEKPIRIQILKARKEGVSTFIQALAVFLCTHTPNYATGVLAHTDTETAGIFLIAKRGIRDFPASMTPERGGGSRTLVWNNDSTLTMRTAGGEYVLSGSTLMLLHMSELPKWQGTKEVVKGQLASLFGAVPSNPNSIVFIEGTANMLDESGEFRSRWKETKKEDSPFFGLFIPWFDDDRYRSPSKKKLAGITKYEQMLKDVYGIDDDQLRWRREKISSDFSGDVLYFRQEFPATEEEAFQAPSGLIFPMLTEQTHCRHIPVEKLQQAGYTFYRGVDWGGSDPWCCIWVAHKKTDDDKPKFSIDAEACPNAWDELVRYYWKGGRPVDKDDHAIDPLRYVITGFELGGHIHVYRELYVSDSVSLGKSILDLAYDAMSMTREPIKASVADPSRGDSILLYNRHGFAIDPYERTQSGPETGSKNAGVMRMAAIMIGTVPIDFSPKPVDPDVALWRKQRNSEIRVGLSSHEQIAAMNRVQASRNAVDPWYGAMR